MHYIGITVKDALNVDVPGLLYENGIIYIRKGETPESLLVPAHELESFKGKIRRLDLNIYNMLNDDFGLHVLKNKLIMKT